MIDDRDDGRGVRRIVVAGGGTAGWMAASALARALDTPAGLAIPITLIESEAIGTVGVGEATIPPIRAFNATVGLDEAEFIRATGATAKLGIRFDGWAGPGSRYFHGFGDHGPDVRGQSWRQYLYRLHAEGLVDGLEPWSISASLAERGRFAAPDPNPRSVLSRYSYAYQFDAGLFARRLRVMAEGLGVERREGRIVEVTRDPVRPEHLVALRMEDGAAVEGDLYLDCSGFRGLLIEQTLGAGYEDWTRWLPCDRAIALPCPQTRAPEPFTTASADVAGWRWRIPLQHRVGNGHVYSSAFIDDQAALDALIAGLEDEPLAEPNRLRFTAGRRSCAWRGNVVALGLAAGFLEPLESTSINLIQTGIGRLLELFPDRDFAPALAADYNRRTAREYEAVRDFIIAHYRLAGRDEPLWQACRETPPPDSLSEKLELFRACGEITLGEDESFRHDSWAAVLTGLGVWPERANPLADLPPLEQLSAEAARRRNLIARAADSVPTHTEFLDGRAAPEIAA